MAGDADAMGRCSGPLDDGDFQVIKMPPLLRRPSVRLHLDDSGQRPWEVEILTGPPGIAGTRFKLLSVALRCPQPETENCPGPYDLEDRPGPGENCPRCGAPAGKIGVVTVHKSPTVDVTYEVKISPAIAEAVTQSYALNEVEFADGLSVTLAAPLAEVWAGEVWAEEDSGD